MEEDWALCVGIGAYGPESGLDPLPGAVRDAQAMRDWLTRGDGGDVPPAQAKLIVSPEEQHSEPPTPLAGEIENFLRNCYRRAEKNANQQKGFRTGRRLWLFYSGHGIAFPSDGDTGLLTADASPPLEAPHVAGKAWAKLFQLSRAFDEVVLFMDCCRTTARNMSPSRPPVQQRLNEPPGRFLAAYAVSQGKTAWEVQVGAKQRGAFAMALLDLLQRPPKTPLTATELLDELARRYPDLDADRPPLSKYDFELLAARPVGDRVLITFDQTTAELATKLSERLGAKASAAADLPQTWFHRPTGLHPPVEDLLITQAISEGELRDVVSRVKPLRTWVVGKGRRGLAGLTSKVTFVAPERVRDLDRATKELSSLFTETRDSSPGSSSLAVIAPDALAWIRVTDERGRVAGRGYGRVEIVGLDAAQYDVVAALGSASVQASRTLAARRRAIVMLPALPLPKLDTPAAALTIVRTPRRKRSVVPTPTEDARGESRCIVKVTLPRTGGDADGTAVELALPDVPGWRTEVFTHPRGTSTPLSVRMVPEAHGHAQPHPSDRMRVALELALADASHRGEPPAADALAGDPIALLLAAALQLRAKRDARAYLDAAAHVLGDDDVDIQLLRDEEIQVGDPPLLTYSWRRALEGGRLAVISDSTAEAATGRWLELSPWLTWTSDRRVALLDELADSVWPGWRPPHGLEPNPEVAARDLSAAARGFGAPHATLRAAVYKMPPVEQLVRHEVLAFAGATNDQLAAAIAVAFVDRGHRPWKRIDVRSLVDHRLRGMRSKGRTGDVLLRARDEAERILEALLGVVATQYSVGRYEGLQIDGRYYFASLWDWTEDGGFIHVSPDDRAQDVRTTQSKNLEDRNAELYKKVVAAWTELLGTDHRGGRESTGDRSGRARRAGLRDGIKGGPKG